MRDVICLTVTCVSRCNISLDRFWMLSWILNTGVLWKPTYRLGLTSVFGNAVSVHHPCSSLWIRNVTSESIRTTSQGPHQPLPSFNLLRTLSYNQTQSPWEISGDFFVVIPFLLYNIKFHAFVCIIKCFLHGRFQPLDILSCTLGFWWKGWLS